MSGHLIIFEGGEGAGKSTLARNLEAALREEGFDVVSTREPGGTPWGEKIRSLLIEKDESIDHHMAPRTQLMGHYMQRFEHLERLILPALAEGKVVISDRFEVSSFAYQVHSQAEGQLLEQFRDLHKHVVELLKPYQCSYVICDIHPEEGLKRVASRGDARTIFDDESLQFHHAVREGTRRARGHIDPHFTFHDIDATQSPEEMLKSVREALRL